jgi:lysophospholipase L1-like esterase
MAAGKRMIGGITALATTAILALAAAAGVLALRRTMKRNHDILNETLPVNSKWWRDQAKLKGELLYAAIGDSAAQGIGASAPGRGYVGVLSRHIRTVTGHTLRVANLSISGATVATAVAEQLPRLRKLKPDIVTVSIGANDIGSFNPEAFETGLREILEALPQHAIVADLPYFVLPHNERKVAVANGILRRLADEFGLTVVPLHETMKRQGITGILTQFARDFFHPNDRGYRIWASAFEPTLTASLIERFPTNESTTAAM